MCSNVEYAVLKAEVQTLEQRVHALETIVSAIRDDIKDWGDLEIPSRQETIDTLAEDIRSTIQGVKPSIALAAMYRVRQELIVEERCRKQWEG